MAKPKTHKIIYEKIKDLIPNKNNARTHSDEQIEQIAESIKEFGFINPVLTDGNKGVIAGHGRILGAERLGMTEVPTLPFNHLTKDQKRAYIIADNKLAENAGWDKELLKLELADLQVADFDLSLIGFGQDEINELLSSVEPLELDDDLPDLNNL